MKTKLEQLPCERLLQDFEFSRDVLPHVSHGIKRGKFQKAVILILFSLDLGRTISKVDMLPFAIFFE